MITLVGCNSKQEKSKSTNPPEDFFSGKELEMGKAIFDGDYVKIETLIDDQNYNPNTRGKVESEGRLQRWTYLGYCILVGEVKSAEKLLELGADINLVSFDGGGIVTNIGQACSLKNSEAINRLLKYNVNLNPTLGGSPLRDLLISDSPKSMLELLLKKGANINYQDYLSGDTVSITALALGKFDDLNYFLDQGADPLLLDSSGNSLAYLIQKEIEDGRLSGEGLTEYTQLKNRLAEEFKIKFPLKDEFVKGRMQRISRYQNLAAAQKDLLGDSELKRIEKIKKGLAEINLPR